MGLVKHILDTLFPAGVDCQPLGEVATLHGGYAFKSSAYSQSGIRIVRISDVHPGAITHAGAKYYPADSTEPFSKSVLHEHDVVVTLTGNVGRVAVVEKELLPAAANQRVLIIRAGKKMNHRFVFHYLNSPEVAAKIRGSATGSAQKNVSSKSVATLDIPVLPLAVQEKIASTLDELDRLHQELQNCQEAEKHVRAAQLQACGAQLFAGGPNPRHPVKPHYVPLGEVATLKRGRPIARRTVVPGPVPVIAGGLQPACYHNQSNQDGTTIVVAGSGANAGFVSLWQGPIFVSDAFSINPDPKVLDPHYCYYFLRHRQHWLHSQQRGAGVPHVYLADIARLPIPIFPLATQCKIADTLKQLTAATTALLGELDSAAPVQLR